MSSKGFEKLGSITTVQLGKARGRMTKVTAAKPEPITLSGIPQ
jgi:hypothetical protein